MYTQTWDETRPFGTELANTLDTIIQNDKRDTRERVAGIFGLNLAQWTADPIVPISLSLSGQLNANVVGNLTGNVTGNLTGTVLTAAQGNITSLGTLTGLTILGGTNLDGNFAHTIFKSASGDSSFELVGAAASGHFNWLVMKSFTVANALQFTPSTAADGSTFTTPVFTLSNTGILTTPSYTGTLNTAAQPNITSVGTLVSTLGTIASKIINGSGQGTAIQYMELSNTGADVVFGIDNSAGGGLATNSTLYSGVIGTINARSFHLATSGIVRQTIDSAGNVVFTGTVTAANFVGPTTLDANNLTGTTLNAGVVNSSLTSVGVLTSLRVLQPAGFNAAGVTTYGFRFATDTFAIGSDASNIYLQSFAGKTLQLNNQGNPVLITGALTASGGMTGNVIGNLTGTILTAAQGNITSLGTLTSLTVTGASTFSNDVKAQGAVGGFTIGRRDTNASSWTWYSAAGNLQLFDVVSLTDRIAIDGSGRFLLGTTSTSGVAAGGIHVAGNSVFDGSIISGGAEGYELTVTSGGQLVVGQVTGATPWQLIFGMNTSTDVGIIQAVHQGVAFSRLDINPNGGVINLGGGSAISVNGATTFNSTVSGITTLTATSIFGTLATASQTNITAVGGLTSLLVNGDTNINTDALTAGTGLLLTNTHASGTQWRIGENFVLGQLAFRHLDGATNPQIANFSNSGITMATGSFIGNLTGNVTGTILTAAQANITSLGTLSALTVTGAITANGGIDFSGNVTSVVTFNTTGSLDFKDSVNNTTRVSVTSTGLTLQAGASLKNGANAVVTARQTGWGSPTATLSRTAVTNADSLATTISHLAALISDLEIHGLIGA